MYPEDKVLQRRQLQQVMRDERMIPAATSPFSSSRNTGSSYNSSAHDHSTLYSPQTGTRLHLQPSYFTPSAQYSAFDTDNAVVQTGARGILGDVQRALNGPLDAFFRGAGRLARETGILPPISEEVGRFGEQVQNATTSRLRSTYGVQLKTILEKFDSKFTLFEMDGCFNEAVETHVNYADGGPGTFFSMDYVHRLCSLKHFHMMPMGGFISTAALIDLCRCPVVFAMEDDNLLNVVTLLCRTSDQHTTADVEWNLWIDTNRNRVKNDDLDKESAKLLQVYNGGSLMKRGLMRLRSQFLNNTAIETPDSQAVRDFFDMDYDLWFKYIFDTHSLLPKPFIQEDIHTFKQLTAPCSRVNACVMHLAREVVHVPPEENVRHVAQQQDLFYANLVHGASVRVPLADIWCPNNQLEHTDRDTNKFFDIMWKSLRDVLKTSMGDPAAAQAEQGGPRVQNRVADFCDSLMKSVSRLRDTKKLMKQIWDESNECRISDRVHMSEIQILQRLCMDGLFPYLNRPLSSAATKGKINMQNIHVCFYMRR